MKKLIYLFLLVLPLSHACAQNTDEWIRQKKTQKKYLVQQIAALQAYAGTLRQGYALVRQGISTVHHIRQGDLGLHQDFFSSLKEVSPPVGQAAKIADILAWQEAIQRDLGILLRELHRPGLLTPEETGYLEQVKARVLEESARTMETLRLILTARELELTDGERLRQVEALHAAMQDTYQFTRSFFSEARGLLQQRARETEALYHLQQLHGLL